MSTATSTIDDTTSFYLGLMIIGLTGLALGLEVLAAFYLSDGLMAGIILILFIALVNGGQILTTSLTQQFKDNPQASFVTAILTFLLTVVSVAFLFMALETKLENDKLDKVRNNPLIQQALLEYNTAKGDYERILAQTTKNLTELQADMKQATIIDNQISQLKDAAQSRFNAENAKWKQDFEQHMLTAIHRLNGDNTKWEYHKITDASFVGGQFVCNAKQSPYVNPTTGKKGWFSTDSKLICEKLNSSYPKPKPMSNFIDQQKLTKLQSQSLELSAAQSALWRINNAQTIMQQKQQALLNLENSLSTDDVSWDIVERIADMTNQDLTYVEFLWLFVISALLYLIRNAMVWLLSFSGSETRQQKAKHEYFHKILVAILTHNRDINIALLVTVAVIISGLTGFYIEGYLLMSVFALIVGIVAYLGLSYYPIDVTVNNLQNVTVTTPDFSGVIKQFEKVTDNVTEYLNNVTTDDNVTKRYDNQENEVKSQDNVTERSDNPKVTTEKQPVTRVTVPPEQLGNVTQWVQNPFHPSFATAEKTLQIGDNVTIPNSQSETKVVQQVGFTGKTEVIHVHPEPKIATVYPVWKQCYEHLLSNPHLIKGKSKKGHVQALGEAFERLGIPKSKMNNGLGDRCLKQWKQNQENAA